jgi:histidine phosphotransferase ChpT
MLDSQTLAALVASKLCHDVVSPVAALTTALDVLDDDQSSEMREHAMGLIRSSTATLAAKLEFYRLALGASALSEGEMDFGDIRRVCEGYAAQNKKITFNWAVEIGYGQRLIGRMLPNLLLVALDCLPRGGVVTLMGAVRDGEAELIARAEGDRVMVKEVVREALSGRDPEGEQSSRMIQPYMLHLAAATARGALVARETDGRVEFVVRAPVLAPAL